jgi:CHAD domain-containing protein
MPVADIRGLKLHLQQLFVTVLLQCRLMAKAKPAPDIEHFGDPYEWAAEILRMRFDEVLGFRDAALDPEQTNGIHDMRVATRRLRGAIRDFVQVIDEKRVKRIKKDLKGLADALGAVRDEDVAVIILSKLSVAAEDASIKTGIADLIEDRLERRRRAFVRLEKTLDIISLDDLRGRFTQRIEDALRQRELFRPASLNEVGREVIEARLKDLCEMGKAIYEPFDASQLHRLRIAAKRLRYAMELFAGCWGEKVTGFAAELAKLQSYLGDVHDSDEWIGNLTSRLKDKGPNKAHGESTSTAAVWLLAEFVRKRSKEYTSALDLWTRWEAGVFFERVRKVVSEF